MNSKILLVFCILFVNTQIFGLGFNLTWESFSSTGAGPLGAKYASGVLDSEDKMYIFGGSTSAQAVNTLSIYNTRTNVWEYTNSTIMNARYGHVAVSLMRRSVMVTFGGLLALPGASLRVNDIDVYDFTLKTWTRKTPSGDLPSVRTVTCATTYNDDTLIIYGGRNTSSAMDDLYAYSYTADKWTHLTPSGILPAARAAGTAVTTGDGIVILFGGWDPKSLNRFNDINFYDVQKNEWLPIPKITGSATARDSHTAILTANRRMIIFGGNNINNKPMVNVECFELATNTWSSISPFGTEPGVRDSVVGVLTADKSFVIFGGSNSSLANFVRILVEEEDVKGQEPLTLPSTSTSLLTGMTIPATSEDAMKNEKSSDKQSATTLIIAVCAAVGGLIVIVIIIVTLLLILRTNKRKRESRRDENANIELKTSRSQAIEEGASNYASIDPNTASAAFQIQGLTKKGWEILWDEMEIETELGRGAFGIVYKGTWRLQNVAVKKVLGEFTSHQLKEFSEEASLMSKLRPHDNVVQLVGVCIQPLAIIIKFYAMGSLDNYLRKNEIDMKTTIRIMKDVAAGMGHLHTENIIHRDLAARNVLLQSTPSGIRGIVSDFGFARVLESDGEGTTKATIGPIKWMAPESLVHKAYGPKSDAWAYGVLMWEIIERKEPWGGVGDVNVVLAVTAGKTLDPPKDCPEPLKELMVSCWNENPEERPDMDQIFQSLVAIEKKLEL